MAEEEAKEEAEPLIKPKTALLSGRGIGMISILLVLEGLLIFAGIKMFGSDAAVKEEGKFVFLRFDKVSATVMDPVKNLPHRYTLKPSLRIAEAHQQDLSTVILRDRAPIFIDRIQNRMQMVPLSRKETMTQLRETFRKDLQAIFNRELLKIPKYAKMYRADLDAYEKQKKDPLTASKALYPGPVEGVEFEEFTFN